MERFHTSLLGQQFLTPKKHSETVHIFKHWSVKVCVWATTMLHVLIGTHKGRREALRVHVVSAMFCLFLQSELFESGNTLFFLRQEKQRNGD